MSSLKAKKARQLHTIVKISHGTGLDVSRN